MSTLEKPSWIAPTDPVADARLDQHGWGYTILCATVASLFVRPADIIQPIQAWSVYQALIIACCIVAFRPLLLQLTWVRWKQNAMLSCLAVLVLAAFASHAWQGAWWEARNSAWNLLKLDVLFLLVLALVNNKSRFLTFLRWQVVIVCAMVGLALADHYNLFDLASLRPLEEARHTDQEDSLTIHRLRGTGIFEDPNDLGMVIVIAFVLSIGFMTQRRSGWPRYLWLVPASALMLGLSHTYSRGAFLSLAASVPAWFFIRGGQRSALLGSLALLPLLALLFSGRMTEIDSIFEGTGQSRIQIWSDALMAFRSAPWFGIGEGKYAEDFGLVAHNSFLQTFTELGFLGGAAFIGLYWVGARSLLEPCDDDTLEHFRGFLFAALIGYAVGLMTLSRQFQGPTFLMLGMIAAGDNVHHRSHQRTFQNLFEQALWTMLASSLFLVGMTLVVKLFVSRAS